MNGLKILSLNYTGCMAHGLAAVLGRTAPFIKSKAISLRWGGNILNMRFMLDMSKVLINPHISFEPLIDSHMHLSLGYALLQEQDYQTRMASDIAKLCLKHDLSKLQAMQLPLVEHVLNLLQRDPNLQLHVQSVSYIDSVFNYALLTHPRLKHVLQRSLFLYIGIHPWFVSPEQDLAQNELSLMQDLLRSLSSQGVLSGIGEIGLDKHACADLSVQQYVLQQLLEFNQDLQAILPVSLHCFKAHNELLHILNKVYGSTKQQQAIPEHMQLCYGTIHGFNSSLPIAQRYCGLNFRLGLGLSWQRAERKFKLMQLLRDFSQQIVTETDFDKTWYDVAPLKSLASYLRALRQEIFHEEDK